MGKEFLPLFLDFNENTQDLSDEQCGRLIRALVDYANGKEYELDGNEKIAFRFLKASIDRNEKLSAIRAEAGSKGGRQTQANASKKKQKETTSSKHKQNDINKNKNKNNNTNTNNDNDNLFDRFWSVYPRHVAKTNARKEFEKANVDETLLQTMLAAIEKSKQSDQWTKDNGQYIPHPSTWIHQRRWEDDLPVTKVKVLPTQNFAQRDYSNVNDQMMNDLAQEMAEFQKGAI